MDYSILVNKDNKIKNNYYKDLKLVNTKDIENADIQVEEKAFEAYLKLKEFLKDKNIEIAIASSYRSIETQESIYQDFIVRYGQNYADSYVATPGYSEHHTGLAIDISLKINGEFIDDNDLLMENTKTFEEIHKYIKDFGFILRYPEGKEDITGYPYEPWHLRYVGIFISNIISDNNLTLEEYKNNYSGVIVVNKEKGYTSFDIVNKISKLFGIKKVGHTGTLDPLAEGVLLVCIGQATKIVELLTAKDKEYVAGVKLGIETDTYDSVGEIIKKTQVPNHIDLKQVLNSYKKTYLQEVPIYSAVKVNGKKLYDYAREGKKVELPKKEVTIKDIELLKNENDTFTFKTLVTKGCYIRSLINDIGHDIGCGAIMTSLVRTKQGKVGINESYKISDIENNNYKLYKIEEVLEYPKVIVDANLEFKIKNGMKIFNNWKIKDKVLFFNEKDKLLGIYERDNQKLRVWKNFS